MFWLRRLFYGDEHKAWGKACRKDIAKAYRRFLSRFPVSCHAKAAKGKLEALEWTTARERDTIEGYNEFLSQPYAENTRLKEARRRISEIEAERQVIHDAVHKILPAVVQGRVQFSESKTGCSVHISAQLLETYSPDDSGPVVKGAYDLHAALYNYVKRRIAGIYRTVFTSILTLRPEEVIVECRHWVRYDAIGLPGGDRAMTLYTAVLRRETAKGFDWASITDEEIQKAWEVRTDMISSVQLQ